VKPAAALTLLRHAFEVRHPSFADPRFVALRRRAGAALVISDAPGWRRFEEVTADFVYIRLHEAEALYVSGYDDRWAEPIRQWTECPQPPDVCVHFDSALKLRAPIDAQALARTSRPHPTGGGSPPRP